MLLYSTSKISANIKFLISKVSVSHLVSNVSISPLVSKVSVSPLVSKVSMHPFGAKVSVSSLGPKVSKVSVGVCISKVLVCASFSICLSSISRISSGFWFRANFFQSFVGVYQWRGGSTLAGGGGHSQF